ncbi:MAG: hypothetical protein R2681_00495 [Pyrinomonadaceae bacterium]
MIKKFITSSLFLLTLAVYSGAQETQVKITLEEQFFEALLQAVFTNLEEPSVPISESSAAGCNETIRLKEQMEGVRTAVRFRQGKISAPIAFEGSYRAPLVGCLDFSGWADTNIELRLDRNKNAIVGNARVLRVNLTGANGLGSEIIAGFVQNSIDRKINPMEIIGLDKLSFIAPVQNAGKLRMRAIGFDHKVNEKNLDIVIRYRFEKAS